MRAVKPVSGDHVAKNRAAWDAQSVEYRAAGIRAWAQDEPTWGVWRIPERDLQAVPAVSGRLVIELGCGTAYWSAWLMRRGARMVALDNSPKQLATAQMLQREHKLAFPLIHGDAEHVPLPDETFDVAFSEYGASLWCDPYVWLPEAARLLKPGGELVFMRSSIIQSLCMPDDDGVIQDTFQRDYFGLHRLEWSDDGSVEFEIPLSAWLHVFGTSGFEIVRLTEVQPPADCRHTYKHHRLDWARRWPTEWIWHLRKRRA
jgi:SAM-dependent methyltransferase